MVEIYRLGQFGLGRQTETNVASLMPVFLHTCLVSRAVSSYRQDELQPRIDVSIHKGPPCGRSCPGSTSQPQPELDDRGSEFGQDVRGG